MVLMGASIPKSEFKIGNLKRHHNEAGHVLAIRKLFMQMQGDFSDPVDLSRAPPSHVFRAVLENVSRGRSISEAGGHQAGKEKAARIILALAESIRDHSKTFLLRCETLNILRDERHKRLQVTWRAATAEAESRSGTFGRKIHRHHGRDTSALD